ncbi:hypothetical protein BXZ70DRAFT_934615 [Cristinia sonorae]|uniref:Uncharacterized protein n=1 Tax=Cristinia sonorae TaxID=1940300 RepID=A0A8K0UPD6_9AGAR|nr:hypothetical protein BXZ70DRAFT_934615 [Cristinia sonorae]
MAAPPAPSVASTASDASLRSSNRRGHVVPSVHPSVRWSQSSDIELVMEEISLKPCSPMWVQHWSYSARANLHSMSEPIQRLPAMELQYRRELDVTEGWETCTHPEGRIYFHRPVIGESKEALTNTILFDNENLVRAEFAFRHVEKMLQEYAETPEDTIIVLDIRANEDFYYCASRSLRRIFWPEETDLTLSSGGGVAVFDISHMANRIEALFWCHVETFPGHSGGRAPVSELRALLNLAYIDLMTSERSTVTFGKDALTNIRSVVDNLQDGDNNENNMWIVARVMQQLYTGRFKNHHGQPEAILNWGDTIPGHSDHKSRSITFRLISPWLFGWPSVYLREVEDIWVNGHTRFTRGQQLITDLKGDWERSTTPATILLTTNVSLLAIQSLDTVAGTNTRSFVQIASYASTLLSLANYMACQILLRQHRRIVDSTADLYFSGPAKEMSQLETMAVIFSLPNGLFLWSMLAFLLAICHVFFHETNIVTRAILGSLLAFLAFLLLAVIMLDWRPSSDDRKPASIYEKISAQFRKKFPVRFLTPRWGSRREQSLQLTHFTQAR